MLQLTHCIIRDCCRAGLSIVKIDRYKKWLKGWLLASSHPSRDGSFLQFCLTSLGAGELPFGCFDSGLFASRGGVDFFFCCFDSGLVPSVSNYVRCVVYVFSVRI